MAAIFFSHSSKDDDLANHVEAWLIKQGFEDIFSDHHSIKIGDKWTETLRRAGKSCRVVLCLVTSDWLSSDECFGEFTAGWYAGRRMIALLSVDKNILSEVQKERLSRVMLEDQGIDISSVKSPFDLDSEVLQEIKELFIGGLRASGALTKVGFDPSVFPIDDRRDSDGNLFKPPFPGLESFGDTDSDAAIFYGRSAEIAQILEELREFRANGDRRAYAQAGRAYVIQGASGSGKSSVLKAGILPRLRREHGWVVLRSFRPGFDPLFHFTEALVRSFDQQSSRQSPGIIRDNLLNHWRSAKAKAQVAETSALGIMSVDERSDMLNRIDFAMLQALRKRLDVEINLLKTVFDRPLATSLISIDQGEELARSTGDNANAFTDYIRAALLQDSDFVPSQYCVAITVRTDSFHELQSSPRLQGINMKSFDLRPLPVYRFAEAIECPAARYRIMIDQNLIETLMEEAGSKDTLPLLAFTLHRLWQQYEQEQIIQLKNYESFGRLPGIIEDAAERALRGFDPGVRQGPLTGKISSSRDSAARNVFIPALAQVNERGNTIRQVAAISDFDDDGREILRWFEKWRLVIFDGVRVEVAHEALFRVWPRFQLWLEPEKSRLETLRNLEIAAFSWQANNKRIDYIIHYKRRLRDAQNLKKYKHFSKQLNRKNYVETYLRAANKIDIGWRLAYRYFISVSILFVLFHLPLIITAYVLELNDILVAILRNSLVIYLIVFSSVIAVYLTVIMRYINIRFGYQLDTLLYVLTGLINFLLAAIAAHGIYNAEQGIGENYTQGFAKDFPEIKQLHHVALYAVAIFSYAMLFGLAVSIVCLVFQVVFMLTIPVRATRKVIARIRMALAKTSNRHIGLHSRDKDYI